MLQVTIPSIELFDERKQEFVSSKEQTLQLEHSLVSISKWESKWCKPFLTKENKTFAESADYVRCMTLTQNVSDDVYTRITTDIMNQINDYISAPMTATTFPPDDKRSGSRQVITAELIYHWMIVLNIPYECRKWHLNQLLTLINLCNIKNNPKKLSRNEIVERNRAINDARRKASNSKG